MLFRPQRRVHLVCRVVAEHLAGRQHEVMRRDLCRHIDAALLGPPDDVDGLGARDMADVQPGAGELGDLYVPCDYASLGGRWPSRKSQLSGDFALMTAGAGTGKLRVLRVLGDDAIKGADVLQRPS